MAAIVVPFRGVAGKQRLAPADDDVRAEIALAMLDDVLEACAAVGEPLVVTADEASEAHAARLGARTVRDGGSGQGAAVGVALSRIDSEPVLIVNADVPCVTARDLLTLLGARPPGGMALVRASDATTNALALSSPRQFAPLYGPGSERSFRDHAARLGVDVAVTEIPNLVDDVDTLTDLERLHERLGAQTRAAWESLALPAAR